MESGIVAVDIGGSHITSVMINDLGKGDFATTFQKDKIDSQKGLDVIIEGWCKNIASTIANAPDIFSNKVAIAIPGPFDYENGIGLYATNGKFGALENVNLKEVLRSSFSQEIAFSFENDAACFGIGESYFGKIKPYTRSMAITLGTGIGCTFLDNKTTIKSGSNVPAGGEIFHLPYKSATADDYFSTRWFIQAVKKKFNHEISGVKELVQSDYNFEAIFFEFADNLLDFLLPIAQHFGAEAIVFGGNISKAWPYFSKPLQENFAIYGIDILKSELNEQAICLGAAKAIKSTNNQATFS